MTTSHPKPGDAAPYYFKYIDRINSSNIVDTLDSQLGESLLLLKSISEEKSLHRYAPDKWSIRQVLNHLTDTERVFLFRAFWFARGFTDPMPSFDQDIAAGAANADAISWASHVEEFKNVRLATLSFFRNLPGDGWNSSGIASGNHVTLNALAYIAAGHVSHHMAILQERYI